ncbi:hypothetical protein ES703_24874 [subsurface metagenome]
MAMAGFSIYGYGYGDLWKSMGDYGKFKGFSIDLWSFDSPGDLADAILTARRKK